VNRVLIVDDSEGVRMTLTAILEDAGYAVSEAASLAEARARLAGEVYEVIILDVMLEDGLGTDLIAAARSALPAAKVVLFSGGAAEEIRGAADLVLAKGGDPMEIVRRLAALCA
jgi:two-component system OmpR family response regulator